MLLFLIGFVCLVTNDTMDKIFFHWVITIKVSVFITKIRVYWLLRNVFSLLLISHDKLIILVWGCVKWYIILCKVLLIKIRIWNRNLVDWTLSLIEILIRLLKSGCLICLLWWNLRTTNRRDVSLLLWLWWSHETILSGNWVLDWWPINNLRIRRNIWSWVDIGWIIVLIRIVYRHHIGTESTIRHIGSDITLRVGEVIHSWISHTT